MHSAFREPVRDAQKHTPITVDVVRYLVRFVATTKLVWLARMLLKETEWIDPKQQREFVIRILKR